MKLEDDIQQQQQQKWQTNILENIEQRKKSIQTLRFAIKSELIVVQIANCLNESNGYGWA